MSSPVRACEHTSTLVGVLLILLIFICILVVAVVYLYKTEQPVPALVRYVYNGVIV